MQGRRISGAFLALVFGVVLIASTGCATTPRIDWASRVGHYTYDQAVMELGPPDKSAQLSDGTLVAEWFSRSRSGPALSFGLGTGFYGRSSAVSVGQSIGTVPAGRQLRLTFAPEGTLTTWSGSYP
jgi:hypothetical protein